MSTRKNDTTIRILVVVCVYIILLTPFLYSIMHALPTSDDFCMTLQSDTQNIFIGSILETWYKYINWSGEFIYFFLQYFLNPLAYATLDSYLYGAVLCVYFLFFVFSFRYFNRAWLTCVLGLKDDFYIELLNTFIISILLFAKNYHEIFYWYVGASYVLEYAFLYVATGAMIYYFSNVKSDKLHYMIFVIMGILCCNAVNMCVVTAVSYISILLLYKKEKITIKYIGPLISYIFIGCVTVFAPGNFVRKSSNSGLIAVLRAFVKGITCNVRKLYSLVENNTVFYMFICLFLTGFIYNCIYKKKILKMWWAIGVLAIALFGTVFPIAYGYGETPVLNNRVSFLLDAIYVPILSMVVFWIGMYIAYFFNISLQRKDYVLIGLIMICSFYAIIVKNRGFMECEYINQIINVKTVREERMLWKDIYNEIYDSVDSNVVISIPDDRYVVSGVLENPQLDEDPGFWINSEIRRYFRKESISIILNEHQ